METDDNTAEAPTQRCAHGYFYEDLCHTCYITNMGAERTERQESSVVDYPTTGTQPAGQIAWSCEEPPTIPAETKARHSWPATVVLAVQALGIGALAAAAILATYHTNTMHAQTNTYLSPPPPIPADTPTVPTVAPAPLPATDPLDTNDHRFLTQLDVDGIPPRNPGTEGAAISTAESICQALADGTKGSSLTVTMTQQGYLTRPQAHAFIQDSVEFFCPHRQAASTE